MKVFLNYLAMAKEAIIAKIQQSKKYKSVPATTVARIVDWAAARSKKPKEIEKMAKNKLHQVYGA